MKKVLLIGFVLAILLIAFPQGVMAETAPDTVTVTAEYLYSPLEFSADLAGEFNWDLEEAAEGGANEYPGALVFVVDSPLAWDVYAADTTGSQPGYLYSPTAAVHNLANPFLIADEGDDDMIDIIAGPIIESGVPADIGFIKTIDQVVEQEDYAANDYSITITFSCVNAWTAPSGGR
jgi:hypothetical protein